jgi:lipopolysaccharide/colanic/teichoic acid biosynthesis glycosyltransferase
MIMNDKNVVKRIFDVCCAIFLLLFFAPVFVSVLVSLLFFNHGEVFFYQERPGYKGEIFKIIKFKTMNGDRDHHGKLLPDAERITKMGKWIRNRSLDELPQLINVLKGEMSMVGPRPLLIEYLNRYDDFQQRRHYVRPGITGLAQVNGRNGISWEEKFKWDIWYVDHHSFLLDIQILNKTVIPVLQGKGVRQEGYVSMAPFKGIHREVEI